MEEIRENPYLQYFLGFPAYSNIRPFDPSVMTWFRERITPEMLSEVNDYIIGSKGKVEEDEKRTPTISEPVLNHLFGEAVQQLWSKRPKLQELVRKSLLRALPRANHTVRMLEIDAFLGEFERLYPQNLVVDRAAVQVMLDFGEVTAEKTIHFYFINGECLIRNIPSKRTLPPRKE